MNPTEERPAKAPSALQILRQRRGGVPKPLVESQRERTAIRRKLVEALKSGPQTVPELARQTGLPRHVVFWHLTAMRKYGAVREEAECDPYFSYALIPPPSSTESSS